MLRMIFPEQQDIAVQTFPHYPCSALLEECLPTAQPSVLSPVFCCIGTGSQDRMRALRKEALDAR